MKKKRKKKKRTTSGASSSGKKKRKKGVKAKAAKAAKKDSDDSGSSGSNSKFVIAEACDDGGSEGSVFYPLTHPEDLESTAKCKSWIKSNAEALQGKRIVILHVKARLSVEAHVTAVLKEE